MQNTFKHQNTETQTDKIIHVHIRTCRKQISAKLRTADIFAFFPNICMYNNEKDGRKMLFAKEVNS